MKALFFLEASFPPPHFGGWAFEKKMLLSSVKYPVEEQSGHD